MRVPDVLVERVSGHLWTLGPHVGGRLRSGEEPPFTDFSVDVQDDFTGLVTLTGRLSEHDDARAAVVVVHGLGGRAESVYMRRAARAAIDAGLSVLRVNLRGADRRGTDFYHAGLTSDLRAVLQSPALADYATLLVLGYSLGGHVVLRAATEGLPRRVAAIATVCAPVDLDRSALAFDRPIWSAYRWHVLRGLLEMYEGVAAGSNVAVPVDVARGIDSIREWDDRIVAPRWGFDGATDYYERVSVAPRLASVGLPALVVAAENDPMVPADTLRGPLARVSDLVTVRWLPRGGHVGFPRDADLGVNAPLGLESQVVHWLARHA